ncbi:DUF983 domain-containing protein [Rubellimicrobium sp. CFH 75288]|uniref:DUF983 domain-containing protein n=1 Tax=Rubellimicrobium sp. CFH 75288 TaxID=2697034 RepID=UPI00141308FC|nr:DUF983 domain-containing protein [Rubellimicrobium sp. CFH 75288]NAZ35817.1 DUF983 domain-containing protein [Rubellimicrobium sp. CFH 75288]
MEDGSGRDRARGAAAGEGERDSGPAMRRGLMGRCPRCGEGRLFAGFLRVAPRCDACGEDLGEFRAADGPAFATISVVALLLIPILGWSFVVLRPDPLTLSLIVSAAVTVLSLVVLRLTKGMWVGYLWAMDERDRGA